MKKLTQGYGRTSILVPSMTFIFGEQGIKLNSTAPFWVTVSYYFEEAISGKDFDDEPTPEYIEISSAIIQGVVLLMGGNLTLCIKDGAELIGTVDDRTYDNFVKLLSEQAKESRDAA